MWCGDVAHTSIGKRAVGVQLKGFLVVFVYNLKVTAEHRITLW